MKFIKENKKYIVIVTLILFLLGLFLPFYKLSFISTDYYKMNTSAANVITVVLVVISILLTYFNKEKPSLLTIIPTLFLIIYKMIDYKNKSYGIGTFGIGAYLSVILLLIVVFLQVYNFDKK